jgi:release factor glutamine methyltransferase
VIIKNKLLTVSEILKVTQKEYKLSPFDAEILLSYALEKPREYLFAHPEKKLAQKQITRFNKLARRRSKNEPIAYILKQKEFYGLDFFVDKQVLVPRPETEILVEAALRRIMNYELGIRNFIDLGTGSGNIIISVLKNMPANLRSKINFYASDISGKALNVTKRNIKKYKMEKIINLKKSDLLDFVLENNLSLAGNTIITANLPYLDGKWRNLLESSDSKDLESEPKIALEGGCDGLAVYRELAKQVRRLRAQNTGSRMSILCEIGHSQKSGIKSIFSFVEKIKFHKDLAGRNRIAEIIL